MELQQEFSAFLQIIIGITVIPLAVYAWSKAAEAWRTAWQGFKTQSPAQAAIVEYAFKQGVYAAEQSALKDGLVKAGRQKLEWATKFVEKYLATFGIKLDLSVIVAGIEAEVLKLKTAQ